MNRRFLSKSILFAMITILAISLMKIPSAYAVSSMTPYSSYVAASTWIQGAEYELNPGKDTAARIQHDLPIMKSEYNINTLNLYGLENISQSDRDLLFSTLSALGMKAVVRIEWYDTSNFAFNTSDADTVINHYNSLLADVSSAGKRGSVLYFALNMPVDDPSVQTRLGGINSSTSQTRQISYASSFVSKMRTKLSSLGFSGGQLYLSVFYGWDFAYDIPSYTGSNADGYFFNNYTYPGSTIPDETATDAVLINQTRLQQGMTKFQAQYSGKNTVIEYGFHTSEFNGGVNPNQTAGLVKTKAAKQKALKATTNFYKTNYANVKGSLYFGYNLLKEEGSPSALMDWALEYPATGKIEGENGSRYGQAVTYADSAASGGSGVKGLDAAGDALAFFNSKKGTSLQIRYACSGNNQLSLYIDGQHVQDVSFPSTGGWTGTYATKTVSVTIPWGATVRLQRDSGDSAVNIDYVILP
ncbi:carbohydrate-binding domain-containing protein [Paenibacillus sp. BK720]|uniref:carbohydrate-binding domain-containing protein n=1 Tax=Paenibacillus sp. BK720 TaxID=2587092 RepID=UPI00141E21C4|nr:carbohydrate-binding domain-containing protein [Paenibacillus sp. BK720]NIK67212.1 hypothetical protein [Paenibacillus sp. BK720]